MKTCSVAFFVAALAACSPAPERTSSTRYALSPDQKHLVLLLGSRGRSIDVETGVESVFVDGVDERSPFGGFSVDSSVFLTRTVRGTIVVTPTSGGTSIDVGEALDMPKISPDGTRIALLRNRSPCAAQGSLNCADLTVVPARGGGPVVVGTGLRLLSDPGGTAVVTGLDQYQFAGSSRIAFTNQRGELWSAQVDGSDLTRIAGSHRSFPADVPLPPSWAVSADGSRIVYSDASGVSVQPARGGLATLLVTDPEARVPCIPTLQNEFAGNLACAFSPDGAHVVVQGIAAGAFYLASIPIAGGTPTTLSAAVAARSCSNCKMVRLVSTTSDVSWTVADENGPLIVSGFVEPRPNGVPISFAPDSSSFLIVRRRTNSGSHAIYPIGDLEVFPISGGPGRVVADNVYVAMWAGPRHVLYERYPSRGSLHAELHLTAKPE